MTSLLLAMTANTIMIFSMKYADKAGADSRGTIFLNYVFGSILTTILLKGFSVSGFTWEEIRVPVVFGIINAFFMVSCMVIQQASISSNGAGLTTTYNRLGVLIPTVLSIFLLHEYPTVMKAGGILLSVIAIVYSYEASEKEKRKNYLLLGLLLVLGGIIDFNSKILSIIAEPELKNVYTFSTFLSCAVLMLVVVLVKKPQIGKKEVFCGALIGIPNVGITFGMVRAAAAVPAYILYPVYSGSVILLVNGIGVFLLKEHLTKREQLSTAMIAVALVLLNI